jgi:hypothetical protein
VSDIQITPISAAVRHDQAMARLVELLVVHIADPVTRGLIADAALELANASMANLTESAIAGMKVLP